MAINVSYGVDKDEYTWVYHLYVLTDYARFYESSTGKGAILYSGTRLHTLE